MRQFLIVGMLSSVGLRSEVWGPADGCRCSRLIQSDPSCFKSLLHLMKSWTKIRIYRSCYRPWLRQAYVTYLSEVLLSHDALPSPSPPLCGCPSRSPCQAGLQALLVLALVLLAPSSSLIHHGSGRVRQLAVLPLACRGREGRTGGVWSLMQLPRGLTE